MSDMTDVAGRIECESHHWVSTNVPGLLTRWIIQCSLCGAYNVEEMNAALSAAGFGLVADAKREAWAEGWAHYRKYFSPNMPEHGVNPYRKASNDDQ